MTLPRTRLGTDGPEVPALSLGSWHTWDRMDPETAELVLRDALAAGVDLFDVGWYNFGPHVEGADTDVLLGRLLRRVGVARGDYLLAQKLWLWNYPAQPLADQLSESLERVGTGAADIAVLGDFFGELDLRRVAGEMAELVRAGTVRCWGVNNWAADDVAALCEFARAEGMPLPVLAQLKYNVCRRSIPEGEPYRRLFGDYRLRLQPSDALEGGILAGNLNPSRRIGADPGGIRDDIRAAAATLAEIAADFDATPARLALAFVLTHPATASVLVGVSRPEQLADNLAAVELAAAHGPELRSRLEGLWADRDVVAATASWGTRRDERPPGT